MSQLSDRYHNFNNPEGWGKRFPLIPCITVYVLADNLMFGPRGNKVVIKLSLITIAISLLVVAGSALFILFDTPVMPIRHFGVPNFSIAVALLVFSFLIMLLVLIWNVINRQNNIRLLEKSVEERTAESIRNEEKYQSLIEQASDAIYILDNDLNFTDVNASMCKMTGYSKDELLSMNAKDIIEPQELKNDPLPNALIEAGVAVVRERTFVRKDGYAFPVEVNVKAFPGQKLMVMARDISQRKKIEAELREAELRFRTLAEKSMVGIYISKNDRLRYVNPRLAEIFGYEPEELINNQKSPADFLLSEEYQSLVRANLLANKGEIENAHFEAKGKKKDGSEIWIEFYGNRAIINGIPAIMGTMLDITERKEAEQQVLREKMLSETIINSLPGCFYLINEENKYLRWNTFMETFTGYCSEEIAHMNGFQLIAPEDHEKVREAIQKVFNEGYSMVEACCMTKDGTRIPLIMTGTFIFYEGQRCLLGVGLDISSKIRAEEELRISEQKYKLLFESSPMPLWMIDKETLNIIAVNDATADLYGYTKEELMNMSVLSVRDSKDRERQLAGYQRGESPEAIDLGIAKHLKKDGTPMFVQIIAHDIIFEGKPVRLSFTNDVTKRLLAEEAIKKSEANLRAILTASDSIYMLFDSDLNILDFNENAIKFFKHELHYDVKKGDHLDKASSPRRFPVLLGYAKRVLAGERINYEVEYPQADGTVVWYSTCLSPISNDNGEILGMLADLHDITDIKLNNQHLQNAYNRIQAQVDRIREMAWKQSHLMRSPLANLKGLAQLLKIKPNDSEALDFLQAELNRLDTIIHEMAGDESDPDM